MLVPLTSSILVNKTTLPTSGQTKYDLGELGGLSWKSMYCAPLRLPVQFSQILPLRPGLLCWLECMHAQSITHKQCYNRSSSLLLTNFT